MTLGHFQPTGWRYESMASLSNFEMFCVHPQGRVLLGSQSTQDELNGLFSFGFFIPFHLRGKQVAGH